MRRILILLAAVALLAVLAPSASAARLDAADFAADCNADGVVEVSGNQRYVGGAGTLTRDCSVTMEPGARLTFRRVDITGSGALVAISSPAQTAIRIIRSSIAVAGPLELTAGCCSGEGDGSEADGKVFVRSSSLTGSSVQLLASFDDPNGKVSVRRSTVTATDGDIQFRASDLNGTNGHVRVRDSRLSATGDLVIASGGGGKTHVIRNTSTIDGTAEVTTGEDGRCRSRRNTPALPCGEVEPPTDAGDDGL